jgi:ATP-dependent DNA ligase
MVPVKEYGMTKDEIKAAEKAGTLSLYEDRFDMLSELLEGKELKNVKLIDTVIVKSMKEAYEHFQELTKQGFEGTIIKAHDMTHKDGNSKKQLKVKLEIYLDMRCTGFTEGKKGTKREETFGAMTFENDEGTIVGQCSGFTDEMLEEINSNREDCIGKVFEIKCNDITLARGKTAHALSHANFQQWRSKDSTDSLERALELKEMAMELGAK